MKDNLNTLATEYRWRI